MSALPEETPVAADTAAAAPPTTPEEDEAEVRNLYAIPHPPEAEETDEDDGLLEYVLEHFQPPAFWTEPTPSPAEELNRAQFGTHLQASGPLRNAAVGYSWVAGALNTKDKAKIWVRSHPTRLITAVLVVGLLLVSPTTRPVVAWILFGLPHLAFEVLTG